MRIETFGDWQGTLDVEERKDDLLMDEFLGENPNSDHNFAYNTIKEPDEVVIELRLRPGKTNMMIEITDRRGKTAGTGLNSGKDTRSYCIYKILADNLQ